MEVKQLRTFVHVAELGSISLAAERLHIAQSALTRQIQALEAEVDAQLFRRHGRGVELTDQGAALFARATVILREIEQARAEIKSEQAVLTGEVSFGMPPTVADVLSGVLIEKFSRLHPRVKLRVVSGYSGHVLDWLQRGAIDLGVLYENKLPSTIRSQPLLLERLFLIEPPGPRPVEASVASLAEIADLRLVLPSRRHGLRLLIDSVAAQAGYAFEPVVEADSLPVQIDLVRRGLGATILPFLSVFADVEAGTLLARPIVEPEITRRLVLASVIDRPPAPAIRQFAAMVMSEVAALVESGRWRAILEEHS
ncbi:MULTISPECIES: LysR family transcriptional regulator [unclassified Chelatococcus]|uniref:LysR family transcriptional regulator n=1 Tax=unclassified Chelatococcus TaxID=2638111 RepID=UPI001BCF07F2|nr:LysR family transcriptional regulator [Chelatococcus sp.]MBS7697652.1 LysR family transcriptional regulator [Chelatococcus sp. YT9]MBX3559026.1 LysR family transcriptional regulator [Chelatococcus sp.]